MVWNIIRLIGLTNQDHAHLLSKPMIASMFQYS